MQKLKGRGAAPHTTAARQEIGHLKRRGTTPAAHVVEPSRPSSAVLAAVCTSSRNRWCGHGLHQRLEGLGGAGRAVLVGVQLRRSAEHRSAAPQPWWPASGTPY